MAKKKKSSGKKARIGAVVVHFDSVPSTNDHAKKLGAQGVREGAVVVSDIQTGGRGRLSRKWISPEGGLWFSILLRPKLPAEGAQLLSLMAGVAVANTINGRCGLNARVKWPNDVLLNGRKVCGILSESAVVGGRVKYVVIGIGINVNNPIPAALVGRAISLKTAMRETVDIQGLFRDLLGDFERIYDSFKADKWSVIIDWTALSDTIGRNVRIDTGDRVLNGTAEGITGDGMLIIRTGKGELLRVLSGDCTHVKHRRKHRCAPEQ